MCSKDNVNEPAVRGILKNNKICGKRTDAGKICLERFSGIYYDKR